MLVLARKVGEAIQIGDDIQVEVVAIRGDKIRLGITAPKSVAVHRKEVAEEIKRAAIIHFAPAAPFLARCGADEPNQKTSTIFSHVTCPQCIFGARKDGKS